MDEWIDGFFIKSFAQALTLRIEMSWLNKIFKKPESVPQEPWAYVRLDFKRTFPHVFWVSSASYDAEAPDGFCYKLFTMRHEPEMIIELLLLRQMENGTKRKVIHVEAPIDKFGTTQDIIRELEQSANVVFERFDLMNIRTWDDFRSKADEVGWDAGHCE